MIVIGVLAQPRLMAALKLTGTPVTVSGVLTGGSHAGIAADGWPSIRAGSGTIPGVAIQPTLQLERYAAVMGLTPQPWQGVQLLGVRPGEAVGQAPCYADTDPLTAEIARQILLAPTDIDPALLKWRLPMIGVWAASRLRAQAMTPTGQGVVQMRPDDAIRITERCQPFVGFFGVERQMLTHALHLGGQTGLMTREALVSGDAAVLLPWDPARDRVLVIEQFRFAPALRGDPQPWLLEPVAGRVDAGETPETAILREAREEADLSIIRLFPAFHAYPSPGALCEFLYQYVGIADLPDGAAGIHGLDSESEDIRGHLLDRAHLSALVDAGQISNGPLATLSMWLDARVDRLRAQILHGPVQ